VLSFALSLCRFINAAQGGILWRFFTKCLGPVASLTIDRQLGLLGDDFESFFAPVEVARLRRWDDKANIKKRCYLSAH